MKYAYAAVMGAVAAICASATARADDVAELGGETVSLAKPEMPEDARYVLVLKSPSVTASFVDSPSSRDAETKARFFTTGGWVVYGRPGFAVHKR